MASHVINQRTDIAGDSGTWAAVVAAWSATSWNGDSGVQAVAAIGAGNAETFISITGGPLNDSVIPAAAVLTSITTSFNWQVFLTAGNELLVSNGFDTPATVTGNATGSISRTRVDVVGFTWQQVLDAHLTDFEWILARSGAAQAGGTARIIITLFQLQIIYTGGAVTFIQLPPVPGRVPVLQGGGRG